MTHAQWSAVDQYFDDLFASHDPILDAAIQASKDAGLPAINVSPGQGKLLYFLTRAHNARNILEIGTLGGYSTIWLARALQPDGKLITLEIDPRHADVARANIERAGLAARVEIRIGAASASLAQLASAGGEPFDLVFIDADKASTPDYLEWSLRLTRPGSLIIIDNVVRNGEVSDSTSTDEGVQGVRRALAMLANDSRLVATALQTVGSKGYDGLALALVAEA